MRARAVVTRHFTDGGAGAVDLAEAVWAAASEGAPDFRLLYPDEASLTDKIETIAVRIYGATGVDVLPRRREGARTVRGSWVSVGCRCAWPRPSTRSATTRRSWAGPTGFRVPVRDVRLSAGAGFVTPLCGEMRTMPGLPSRPGGESIDIDADGNIVGLF